MDYLPRRKSTRLKNYDYSQNGVYFITICTQGRCNLFCETVGAGFARPPKANPPFVLSAYGMVIENALNKLSDKYPEIVIDKSVIMPNHIHCVLIIDIDCGRANPAIENGRADPAPTECRRVNPAHTIGNIIGYFKYQTTKEINISGKLWQRGYYEHIIRDEAEYIKIWEYIDLNPRKWQEDSYFDQSET